MAPNLENSATTLGVGYACTEGFDQVLAKLGISLAVTTYQAGKLCFIRREKDQTTLTGASFKKAMGLYVHSHGMLLGTLTEVISFINAPSLAERYYPEQPCDAIYIPQMSFTTGNMAVHDVAVLDNQIIAVSTLFSSLVVMSPEYSFVPLWKPKFITELAGQDRCHLNSIALENGKPRYATALSETNTPNGWREVRATGGCVIDIARNEVICRGMAMPHSPRLYAQDLWVLSSGTGELGIVTPHGFEALLALPGFLRGLAFAGPFAFVGLSKIREKNIFGGLPIEEKAQELKCGIYVVNIETGQVVGWLEFTEGVEEIYDVQILPFRHPILLDMKETESLSVFHLPKTSEVVTKKRS